MSPWSSWFNAEVYDRFVREHRIYDWLNTELIRLAGLAGARRVLDLGCGTGATTRACLREMDPTAEIVGIDASEEMVAVARAGELDPRARFEVLPAASLDRLDGDFDRVVCNAAVWQFPTLQPVFRALRAHTGPGAPFVFNIPAERVVGEQGSIHPFQVTLLREIESELGQRLGTPPALIDPDLLRTIAAEHGFEPCEVKRLVYEGVQDELMQLMSIPAMISPLCPGMSDERCQAIWRRARETSDPELRVDVPWLFYGFERPGQKL